MYCLSSCVASARELLAELLMVARRHQMLLSCPAGNFPKFLDAQRSAELLVSLGDGGEILLILLMH